MFGKTKVNNLLPGFPGFAVAYDTKEKPYFVVNVLEDMNRIASKPIGVKLLRAIATARPTVRRVSKTASQQIQNIKFLAGVNVVITPTSMTYMQSGHKMGYTGVGMEMAMQPSAHKLHNIDGCTFYPTGGCSAEAGDIMAAGVLGQGSVSVMKYTNAQIMTAKGESTVSFIVLAHELIHCLHHVTGTRKDSGEEEWTSGIGDYADAEMTENAFRAQFNLGARENY